MSKSSENDSFQTHNENNFAVSETHAFGEAQKGTQSLNIAPDRIFKETKPCNDSTGWPWTSAIREEDTSTARIMGVATCGAICAPASGDTANMELTGAA